MIEDQTTSQQEMNVTDKENISVENTLSKHEVCSNKDGLKKPESAEVTTCNKSESSGNLKNIKTVSVNNQESTIISRELAEKKNIRTPMATNVNNSMERFV